MADVVMTFGTYAQHTPNLQNTTIQKDETPTPTLQKLSTPKRKLHSPETPHSKVRKVAEHHFLKNANRQQVNYDRKKGKMNDDYVAGDTVGIRIPKPDRTNTSRTIMTCKVIEKKTIGTDFTRLQVL